MKRKRIAAIISLAVLLVCIGLTHASAEPMIKDIRFESPTATADRIIFELNGPYLPTGKALPGANPRVYFDFPGTAPANKVKNRIPANGNFVKQIRYAYHKGTNSKTRVVLDLMANQKMDFKQDFDKDTNTLAITLYLAGTLPESVAAVSPPEPESEPVIAQEPAQPEAQAEDIEKTVQPIENVTIAVAPTPEEIAPEPQPQLPPQAQELIPSPPKPAMRETPVATIIPKPKPVPAPEPVALPEPEQKQTQQEETLRVAGIQPSTKGPNSLEARADDATVIQPMSEIGIQEKANVEYSAPVLYSIEFDPKSNRGEIISFKLNGFHPPVVFGIEEDIPRIICFFKNATAGNELRDMIGTNGRYVKNIKIGKYQNPDNIRVILELVPGNNYDLQQVFFKDDKVFMMVINQAGKQITRQSKE